MKNKGFSLIEILVAIVILGTLLIVTLPFFLPEKLKFDEYANSFVNLLYRAKMAAIFNLYNANILYNRNTGVFSVYIDENRNNIRDNNERIIHSFPRGLDFLTNSQSRLSSVRVFNGNNWVNLIIIANETNIIIFDRLGFASTTTPNTQIIDIYLTNNRVLNRFRYEYVVRVTSGGSIRLIRRRIN